MKKVYIVHGWGGNPDEGQLKWLREQLTQKGFEVIAPEMPDTGEPEIKKWVGHLSRVVKIANQNTYFIGHSIGCQAILRYIETLPEVKIGGMVLIAPWMQLDLKTIEEEGEGGIEIAKPWIETPIDFEKVKKSTKNIVAVFSVNDPFVLLEENKKLFEEKLGAKTFVDHEKGHYTEEDGVYDNPTALKALLDLTAKS